MDRVIFKIGEEVRLVLVEKILKSIHDEYLLLFSFFSFKMILLSGAIQ